MEMFAKGYLQGQIVKLQLGFLAYQKPQLQLMMLATGLLTAITCQEKTSCTSTQPSPALHPVPMIDTASASQVKLFL